MLENQLSIERSTNRSHQITFSDLEKKLISLGQDPRDRFGISSLVKEKEK
jgi:hypothetical protein